MLSTSTKAAEAPRAGKLLAEYHAKRVLQLRAGVLASFGLSLAIVSMAMGVWAAWFALQNYGVAAVGRWIAIWAAAAGILGLAGLWACWRLIGLRQEWVRLYPSGLALRARKGMRFVPWEAIHEIRVEAIRFGLPVFSSRQEAALSLRFSDGGAMRLTQDLEGFDAVLQRTKEEVYPRLINEYSRAFNAGSEISFGPLRLNDTGLATRRSTILWNHLHSVDLEHGTLRISGGVDGRQTTTTIRASRVPNLDLCLQLIRRLGPHL